MSEQVQAAVDEVSLAIVQLASELRADKDTPPGQRVDSIKTLADSAASLLHGPQGGNYYAKTETDYRHTSDTDYKYTADLTHHETRSSRRPVGFDGRHP